MGWPVAGSSLFLARTRERAGGFYITAAQSLCRCVARAGKDAAAEGPTDTLAAYSMKSTSPMTSTDDGSGPVDGERTVICAREKGRQRR